MFHAKKASRRARSASPWRRRLEGMMAKSREFMYEASTLQTRSSRHRASKISGSVADFQLSILAIQCDSVVFSRRAHDLRQIRPKFWKLFTLVSFEVPFEWNVIQFSRFFYFVAQWKSVLFPLVLTLSEFMFVMVSFLHFPLIKKLLCFHRLSLYLLAMKKKLLHILWHTTISVNIIRGKTYA